MYEAEQDPYCYDGTSVLRNRFDIRDVATLEGLEIELTTARADEPLPDGDFDIAHYRAIHRHLFQDLYQWAGESRIVRISKGSSHFCFPEYIDAELARLFAALAREDRLRGLSRRQFAERAASFLATLNMIHAFREGNGRTQLTFLVLVADQAGHPLDLAGLDPEAMLQAMIASFYGDEQPLAGLIEKLAGG